MKNIQLFKKQAGKKGFALTEVLLAIAVIVIIGIAAYPLYKNARTTSEVEALANDMAIIQTNVQTLYSGQSSYLGLTSKQLDQAGLTPDDIRDSTDSTTVNNGKWINPWGGPIDLLPNVAVGTLAANSGFTITIEKIPQSACTQLVNRVAPAFTDIGIGAAGGAANDGQIKGVTAPQNQVIVGNIQNACTATAGSNFLAFTAR